VLRAFYASGKPMWLLLSGRRGGKSLLSDVIACFESVVSDFPGIQRAGEDRHVLIASVRQDSASAHIRQIGKMLRHTPELGAMIVESGKDKIRLSNGVVIMSLPASARATRGWTASCIILDEAAFFVDSDGNASAGAVLDALIPTTATFGDAAKIVIPTTPSGRTGLVFDLFERAREGLLDDVFVTQKATRELNPKVSEKTIAKARARDPESASAEYDAQFREPVEAFLNSELVDKCVEKRGQAVQAASGVNYVAAVDPAYMQDRFGMVVAHRDGQRVVVDVVRLMHPLLL